MDFVQDTLNAWKPNMQRCSGICFLFSQPSASTMRTLLQSNISFPIVNLRPVIARIVLYFLLWFLVGFLNLSSQSRFELRRNTARRRVLVGILSQFAYKSFVFLEQECNLVRLFIKDFILFSNDVFQFGNLNSKHFFQFNVGFLQFNNACLKQFYYFGKCLLVHSINTARTFLPIHFFGT